jgi:PHD/YefM family antitoxin component YafN of YafNO toxin-antitoxin module
MRTIPAREIKRRGISAVDELLCEGPVHVIKNDEPRYVVMTESHYAELVEDHFEAQAARIQESIEDIKAGRTRVMTAQEMIEEFGLED